ncbi:F0F1 ATP synthase subunit delta, partial [Neisseria sp. P0001.S006]|uniref:F0F1 ATP synthase subunit delta n=1 Tax=Neisseria sp. P0001.S006 TaxID=3436650 RepID=UPI003F7DF4CA
IYSAYELSSQQLSDVTDILTKRFNSKLDVVTKVATELIGGIKVEVGDQVLDLSVQGKLNALYATITN